MSDRDPAVVAWEDSLEDLLETWGVPPLTPAQKAYLVHLVPDARRAAPVRHTTTPRPRGTARGAGALRLVVDEDLEPRPRSPFGPVLAWYPGT